MTMSTEKKQIPIVCPGHTRPLAELQFCHADDLILLVSACHDRAPMIRDGVTGDWIGTWKGHKGAVWSCRVDPTASLAATASGDFSAAVWDAITGAQLFTFPHKHIVKTCDFSPNSQYLATGGHEGLIRIYDLIQQEQLLPSTSSTVEPIHIQADCNNKVVIGKVHWWTDSILIAGCADGKIRFWNLENVTAESARTLQPFHTINTTSDGSEIRDMEITTIRSAAERLSVPQQILTVAAGDSVYFYSLCVSNSTFVQLIHAYPMPGIHFREEGGASLHPSGKTFIAGGSDLWVRVFDFDTGKELECLKGHHGPIRCLRYSPDGKRYASGSEDGTIRLWQVSEKE